MTRLEILNIRLDQISNDLEKLENRRSALWHRRKDELKRVLEKFFQVTDEKFTVDFTDLRASLRYSDSSRYSGIVEAVIDERWSREDDADRGEDLKIHFNGSTFTQIGEWVLDEAQARFEFMQCAVDHKDDILAEWNTVSQKYESLMSTFWPKEKELRAAYNNQQKDITAIENENMMTKLTSDGVEFTKDKRGNLPELEVKWDWTLRNVASIKVTRTTPSGKSADLVVTQKFRNWNTEGDEIREQLVEKVRMDKINRFLRFNDSLISK